MGGRDYTSTGGDKACQRAKRQEDRKAQNTETPSMLTSSISTKQLFPNSLILRNTLLLGMISK